MDDDLTQTIEAPLGGATPQRGTKEGSAPAGGPPRPSSRAATMDRAAGRRQRPARGKAGAGPSPDGRADGPQGGIGTEASPDASAVKQRRRRRSRRRRAPAEAAPGPEGGAGDVEAGGEPVEEPEAAPGAREATREGEPKRARRRRRPKGRDGTEAPAEVTEAPAEDAARPTRVRRPRLRRRREPAPPAVRAPDKVMLITERGDRDQIAVVEGERLVEHHITRTGARSMVGNIYLGRVQNVLPGMEAAFVDVGRGRNAVLYAGEVTYDEDVEAQPPRIEKVLRSGQAVMVQVTKDPIGGKGPRLTTLISLPGRYLVLVPNSDVFGISRRLPDNERRRLRALVKKVRPERHGVIVRTAAEGASQDDLAGDVGRLVQVWEAIEKKAKRGKAPTLLYEEPELLVRIIRDLFTAGEFREIVTDSPDVRDKAVSYLREVAPDLVDRVRLYDGPLPMFEEYRLVEQIHKALERKVWLPSGGYIVIDRTEAMTVIDVNTGKHVGTTTLEETVVRTNLEAAEEIARQLRLRDIGGIIIIDFIDMLLEQNKHRVIETLKAALARDKTKSQVFDISPLGLLEVTRKRVSAGLLESFSEVCPTCEGRGILVTHEV